MEEFDLLVKKQLQTMDKLLFLQSEIERCQQIEKELMQIQNETTIMSIKMDIHKMKEELRQIQQEFELQTKEVITMFQCKLLPTT